MALLRVVINDQATISGQRSDLNLEADSLDSLVRLGRYIGNTVQSKNVEVGAGETRATGTVTFSSFVQPNTVTVNGQALTGVATPSGVAEFAIGGSDTLTALNFAALVDDGGIAVFFGIVSADSSSTVATLTADVPGVIGNAITLAISANGSVSGSRLSGGNDGQRINIQHGLGAGL